MLKSLAVLGWLALAATGGSPHRSTPPLPGLATIADTNLFLPASLVSGDNDVVTLNRVTAGAKRPDLVQICLSTRIPQPDARQAGSGRKAFDNHETRQPRFLARPGRPACTHVQPTRHRFIFWKEGGNGAMRPVLKQALDLSGMAGDLVRFEWRND